jgi:molybdate transport system substrate-binding protein
VQLVDGYKRAVGGDVRIQFMTGPELAKRIAAGEPADILIAPEGVVNQALADGAVVADAKTTVARVGVGVTVRRGATLPAVNTLEALKAALLAADSVVYNQASTGLYLDRLFDRLGILESLKPKTTRYADAARVLEHVIAGRGNEIGFGPITEIKDFEPKGLVLVAPLPAEVQNYTTYVAAMTTRARTPESLAFIRTLTTDHAKQTFAAVGAQ